MRMDNLLCVRRRKFIFTTDSKHGLHIYPNLAKDIVLTDELKFRALSEAEACTYLGGFAVVRGQYHDGTAILNKALQLDPNVAVANEYFTIVGDGDKR
jgi:hypothetical protein